MRDRASHGSNASLLRLFSVDYATARERFRQAAALAGWSLVSHETGETAPGGTPLTVDVAESEPAGADRPTLILSSGLHGVEGHFGSAVQLAALGKLVTDRTWGRNLRCVFVHALNPYGFAWSRRCDARNVDLNRAFRWSGMAESPPDDAYRRIDGLLNPRRPPSADLFGPRLVAAALRFGPATLKRTIASGQRSHPKGLFYAGAEPPPLQGLLARELPQWIGRASTVVHLDLHTGLGQSGDATLIVDYPMTDELRAWWRRTFGHTMISEPLLDPKAYTASGGLGQWCVSRELAPRYLFAFAEFGTFGGARVLAALRAENQAHHWADASDPVVARSKARLREAFCPADPSWRLRAVQRAMELIGRGAGTPWT
ncbi:MAG: DUF2817 domain-containing protein [Acidobacteriota bacterium]